MAREFAIAEGKRVEITNEQVKQIRDMYKDISNEYKSRIKLLSTRTNISSQMRSQYLKDFTKSLEKDIQYLNSKVESTITTNILRVSKAVVDDNLKMCKEMGFGGIMTQQFYVPNDVVARVISGKLYEGKWTLSKAIWSDNQKKISDINSVVAKGIAENKSTYEIAKDLERYVNPRVRKDWNWSKVYPGTNKKIDYNAQRLARTMVSHAYQESFVESTKDNPFIEAYMWVASGGDRMCPLCEERDGEIFSKEDLPMDHPNGMCTFEVVIDKSYEEIGRELADWVNGEGDPELNAKLDDFAEELGYNVKSMTAYTEPVQKAEENVYNEAEKVYNENEIPREQDVEFIGDLNANTTELLKDRSYSLNEGVDMLAAKTHMSPEEIRSILTEGTQRLYDNNGVAIRADYDNLESILNGGFKNQFQTGTSNAALSFDTRKTTEEKVFNLRYSVDNNNLRPVYGSLLPNTFVDPRNKEYVLNGDSQMYGDTIFYLKKDSIMNNATLTLGDSVNERGLVKGTPLNDINVQTVGLQPASMDLRFGGLDAMKNGSSNLGEVFETGSYVEVQIFGEQSKQADCIEKIVFIDREPESYVKELLNERNIPWETLDRV
jgi:SPP1 gp7 family putative phage head morphogenesis protein